MSKCQVAFSLRPSTAVTRDYTREYSRVDGGRPRSNVCKRGVRSHRTRRTKSYAVDGVRYVFDDVLAFASNARFWRPFSAFAHVRSRSIPPSTALGPSTAVVTCEYSHTREYARVKPRPHQQQCRSNIVECYKLNDSFDKVETNWTCSIFYDILR